MNPEVVSIERTEPPLTEYIDLYRSLGLCVIPAIYGDKRPEIAWEPYQRRKPTEEEVKKWFYDGKPHNLAIVCGRVSNLVVLDFDDVKVYEKFFNTEKIERETIVVRTGGGKRHVYLRSAESVPSFKIPQIRLEVRSDGNIVIAPNSLHPNGHRYEFVDPGVAKVLEVEDLLDDVMEAVKSKFGVEPFQVTDQRLVDFEVAGPVGSYKGRAPPCVYKLLAGAGEGFRNEAAARLASFYLRIKGWGPERAWKRLQEWNTARNRPPLDERELRSVFRSIAAGKYTYLCRSLAAFCDRPNCRYIRQWLTRKSVEELLNEGEP